MMKSLAVYGDSFGTYSLSGTTDQQQRGFEYHWSSLLSNHYGCKLFNYAVSGSSVYYSYKKFMDTHHLYDCVIFLVTEPNRYINPLEFTFGKSCVTNGNQIDVWKKTRKDLAGADIKLLNKLDSWFELTNDEYSYDISELMIEKVIQWREDVIVLPCYNISMKDEFREHHNIQPNTNLCSLYYKQMAELQLSDVWMNTVWIENSEYVSGHLTPEYNRVAYENIKFFIENKFWDWKIPVEPIIKGDDKVKYFNKV